jgi:CheY-like chemotaxis protein
MSHELRTPLNGVLGHAQLLQRDRSLSPSQREAMEAISRCGSQLLELINDVLDLSKIEAGRLDIDEVPTDLAALVTDLRHVVGEAASRKGLQLTITIEPDVPRWALLDGRHLRQVLLNLLGNAIKFTTAGEVECTISCAAGPRLAFAVRDTGTGIEPEALTEIFAAFAQTKAGAAAGGTGLGLAISDHLIRRMGGHLAVESVVGEGSRFSFTLPLLHAREGAHSRPQGLDGALPSLDARLAPGQEITALVVDDSPANRHILASLLESAGVRVITAAGGLDGVEMARSHRPQIVFMDLRMDDLDGFEATRRLARDPATAAIPVVAVTASVLDESQKIARAAGCVDYLSKPVRAELLFAVLQTHLGLRFVSGGDEALVSGGGVADVERRVEIGTRLRHAVAIGDVGEIQELARNLMAGDVGEAAVGERISRLATHFDFDGLSALADSLAT